MYEQFIIKYSKVMMMKNKKNLYSYMRFFSIVLITIFIITGSQGCSLFRAKPKRIDGSALTKLSSRHYPEFTDDMVFDGLDNSIRESLSYLKKLPKDREFWFGDDSYTTQHMILSLEYFLHFLETNPSKDGLNKFITSNFLVYKSKGRKKTKDVLFTGYYEPILDGSEKQSPEYPFPVFPRPDDLAMIDLSLFNSRFKGEKPIIGRVTDDQRIVPYYERREITENLLFGKVKPLAYVKDRVDLFFLEIQGSGKIYLDGGNPINVHYHASNGRPYKSIGALLIKEGKILKEEMSMQKIRSYLHDYPEEIDDILNYNESFVFFKLEDDGPFGCLGVKVTPGRSIALERRIFPAAAICYMESQKPLVDGESEIQSWQDFSRFVLNQDTGGAIKGPGRADLFWGNGPYAEIAAGYMQHPGHLYFLVLKYGVELESN